MSKSSPQTAFAVAAKEQIELWNNSRHEVDTRGKEVYSGTTTPVIIADETVGGHEFNERKAEDERRSNGTKQRRVGEVAATNRQSVDRLQKERSFDGMEEVWNELVEGGSGAYRGLHPVMYRKGVYIYGCPHLVTFEDFRPTSVVRLRGTQDKYLNRPQPFANQLIGPWLTCRMLDRGGFDVSDLSFIHLRYDREKIDVDRLTNLSQLEQSAIAQSGLPSKISLERAVGGLIPGEQGLEHFAVDTYDYDAQFTHESVNFANRLRRSISIVRGDCSPKER